MLRMAITLLCHILPTLILLLLFYGVHDAVAPDRPVVEAFGVHDAVAPDRPIVEVFGEDHMIIETAAQAQPEPLAVQPTATPTGRLRSLDALSLMPDPTSGPSQSGQLPLQDLVGGIPSGLRSLVQDRPASSPGCLTTKCRVFYPVRCLEHLRCNVRLKVP